MDYHVQFIRAGSVLPPSSATEPSADDFRHRWSCQIIPPLPHSSINKSIRSSRFDWIQLPNCDRGVVLMWYKSALMSIPAAGSMWLSTIRRRRDSCSTFFSFFRCSAELLRWLDQNNWSGCHPSGCHWKPPSQPNPSLPPGSARKRSFHSSCWCCLPPPRRITRLFTGSVANPSLFHYPIEFIQQLIFFFFTVIDDEGFSLVKYIRIRFFRQLFRAVFRQAGSVQLQINSEMLTAKSRDFTGSFQTMNPWMNWTDSNSDRSMN